MTQIKGMQIGNFTANWKYKTLSIPNKSDDFSAFSAEIQINHQGRMI